MKNGDSTITVQEAQKFSGTLHLDNRAINDLLQV